MNGESRRALWWRGGVIACAAAAGLLPIPARWIERTYSTGVYLRLQPLITGASNLAPFALLDVLIVVIVVFWIARLLRDLRRGATAAVAPVLWRTATVAASLYLAFLVVWGFNYRRVPLAAKLEYSASDVSYERARSMAIVTVDQLNALHSEAHAAGVDPVLDGSLARAFVATQRALGAPLDAVPGRPKETLLEPYFRRAAVSGMTDPFFLETLVEARLLAFERPFVVAHEWSHLAGYADEGEANFGGWLVCMRGDAAAQYSGWLFLYSEIVPALPRDARAPIVARLGAGPRADLAAIRARMVRDVSPRVSAAGWRVYDRYLKANRVDAGAASYQEVVRLLLGTHFGPGWLPLRKAEG